MSSATVQLLSGPEPSLLADAVRAVVDELIGNDDRGLLLQDLSGEDYTVDELVDAAQTVPFLTERRVVVARGLSRFAAPELGPLVQYLSDPAPTTDLVIEWGSGRVPKVLTDAIDGAGGSRVNTGAPGNAKGRRDWFAEQFDRAGVVLDARARTSIVDRLGEDVGRLGGILATLEGVFGAGARLGEGDIAPYLGGDGGVPPWDLTDAIDAGDLHTALTSLERMLGAGARHPLQIMATLHSHYERMLRLDGARVANDKDAAAVLGMKGSTFPAKKALNQGRRLGHDGVARALALLANADLDLRGRSGLEGRTVMEVLVARLSRL